MWLDVDTVTLYCLLCGCQWLLLCNV